MKYGFVVIFKHSFFNFAMQDLSFFLHSLCLCLHKSNPDGRDTGSLRRKRLKSRSDASVEVTD